mmetsp:Transcript_22456/g.71150  ORF Transcript_22456/g.71150 Transcript_22456/m.71150 type:complete len:269 (-) Transcript_22456:11-817(-)
MDTSTAVPCRHATAAPRRGGPTTRPLGPRRSRGSRSSGALRCDLPFGQGCGRRCGCWSPAPARLCGAWSSPLCRPGPAPRARGQPGLCLGGRKARVALAAARARPPSRSPGVRSRRRTRRPGGGGRRWSTRADPASRGPLRSGHRPPHLSGRSGAASALPNKSPTGRTGRRRAKSRSPCGRRARHPAAMTGRPRRTTQVVAGALHEWFLCAAARVTWTVPQKHPAHSHVAGGSSNAGIEGGVAGGGGGGPPCAGTAASSLDRPCPSAR